MGVGDHGAGNGHGGTGNGWVRNNNNAWNDVHQTINVQANHTYTLTGWVRTSSNNTDGYFGLRTPSGQVLGEKKFAQLNGYTNLSVAVNTGANTSVVVYGGLWANGDTWLQIDDVTATAS